MTKLFRLNTRKKVRFRYFQYFPNFTSSFRSRKRKQTFLTHIVAIGLEFQRTVLLVPKAESGLTLFRLSAQVIGEITENTRANTTENGIN